MNNPDLFTEVNSLSHRFGDYFSKEFDDEIREMSGRCIDIGSGPGDVVVDFILPKLNPEATIVCSDISDKMVEFGNEKYKNNNRISFIRLDIETPNLPTDLIEQFDHVTSFYCIHWCQDMRLVFENIFKLLRPGGTSVLTFIARFRGLDAYKELAAMPQYQPYMKNADRYIPVFQHSTDPRNTLKAIIKDVGFEIHHCSIREQSHVYNNSNVFGKFMMSVNPFIDRIPANLHKEYEKDLATEVARKNIVFNKNNNVESEYSVLCMYDSFMLYLEKPLIS